MYWVFMVILYRKELMHCVSLKKSGVELKSFCCSEGNMQEKVFNQVMMLVLNINQVIVTFIIFWCFILHMAQK